MSILLVEDDECTQAMIADVLKRLDPNIDVEVAANGDDALTRYLKCSCTTS
jgi:CheY-like chemotaxis protein